MPWAFFRVICFAHRTVRSSDNGVHSRGFVLSEYVHCPGEKICIRNVCQCPLYRAMGGDCHFSGYHNKFQSLPYANTKLIHAWPGSSCGHERMSCTGGSFCQEGRCGCPDGHHKSGYECIYSQNHQNLNFMGAIEFGGMLGYPGSSCAHHRQCTGGSYCKENKCCCPVGSTEHSYGCISENSFSRHQFGDNHIEEIFGFPGSSCGSHRPCTGGSYCKENKCCCPDGHREDGYRCVSEHEIVVGFPGSSCRSHQQCRGGSYCKENKCCCPVGYRKHDYGCALEQSFYGNLAHRRNEYEYGFEYEYEQERECSRGCYGGQLCLQNKCCCPGGFELNKIFKFCMPSSGGFHNFNSWHMDAKPGMPCGFHRPCTGGSECRSGVCCCPEHLSLEGDSCVYREFDSIQKIYPMVVVSLGSPCSSESHCSTRGAVCSGVCKCGENYDEYGRGCRLRRSYPGFIPWILDSSKSCGL